MKILEKITLSIYSLIILVESIIAILLIFGWAKVENIVYIVKDVLNNHVAYNTVFAISIVFIILSIKAILFGSSNTSSESKQENLSKKNAKMGDGVLLENEDGKLLISRETIERLANSVVKNFSNIQDARTKVSIDNKNNIAILVELQILQNTVIKELNTNLQLRIKEVIKKATDLDVNEVNVKIKNIINIPTSVEENEEEEE